MTTPSRGLVSSPPATLLLRLLAGAADAAPPLLGVSPQGVLTYSNAALRFFPSYSITHEFAADEAYFAPQVIAFRDGSGYFPRNRLNDGYCDCADGTDEPGICLELPWICPNFTSVRGSWVSCGDLLGSAGAVRSSGNKLAGHWVSIYVPTIDLLVNVRS
jgi:hypothetical protein